MQVVELELAKEYALRVRELAAQEQLAGQAEAHAEELRSHRQLLQAAEQQREHSLAERDRREQVALEKHQVHLGYANDTSQMMCARSSQANDDHKIHAGKARVLPDHKGS